MKKLKLFRGTVLIDIDIGEKNSTIFLSGMGRSGTTWVSEIINHDNSYREIFEPFMPYRVKAAEVFKYYQYINQDKLNDNLAKRAQKILSGKFRSKWTDTNNKKLISTKRIIKDIRTNLMLKWLHNLRPNMPIILLIRHPLAIISSWRRLGWGIFKAGGDTGDTTVFESVIQQEELFHDFPMIADTLQYIDQTSYFDQIVFLWCVFHYVPLRQFGRDEYYVLFYENLVLEPQAEFGRLFSYLEKDLDGEEIIKLVKKPSRANFQQSDFTLAPKQFIHKYRSNSNQVEFERAKEILQIFELDKLYDAEGIPSF